MERSGGRVRTGSEAGDRRENNAIRALGVSEAHMRFVLKYHAGALHLANPRLFYSLAVVGLVMFFRKAGT